MILLTQKNNRNSEMKRGFQCGLMGKESSCKEETWVPPLSQEDPLEEGMATHSNILAYRMPWTEGPGGL